MPVLETKRRKNHIDLINPTHKLLPIIINCLKYQEKDRPSSEEICQRLNDLKESRQYREITQRQENAIQAKDDQIASLTEQLLENINQLQQQTGAHQRERIQLTQEIALREDQLQKLNIQLKEQEQISAELQQIYHFLQRQVEQLQQQLSQQSLKSPQPPPPSQVQIRGRQHHSEKQSPSKHSIQATIKPYPQNAQKVILMWRSEGYVPFSFGMVRGAAVVNRNVAYFMNREGKIFSYSMISKSWNLNRIPVPPYGDSSSLAVINNELTTIGGCDFSKAFGTYTNKLLSLLQSHESWVETFPPMPTSRGRTTAVTSNNYLIVAGGDACHCINYLNTVEVMDIKHLVWSTVAGLPHLGYSYTSGTICGDQLYMLGGLGNKGRTKSVLTCSLTELLQSSSSSSSSIWHRVADAPMYYSTCAAVNGELLAIGGLDNGVKPTSAVYNPKANSWALVSNMPTASYQCLVAVFPTNEMMVVGGNGNPTKVEIANA